MASERLTKTVASLCLGFLVGTLIGLSIHAVVGTALAALLALLAGFLGLTKTTEGPEQSLRTAAFALATLLALLVSVYARTHQLLSPDYEAELTALQKRHVLTDSEAHDLFIYERFGLLPTRYKVTDAGATKESTVLFDTPHHSDCAELQAQLFSSVKERLDAMRAVGGSWSDLAADVSQAKPTNQAAVLDAGFDRLCNQ